MMSAESVGPQEGSDWLDFNPNQSGYEVGPTHEWPELNSGKAHLLLHVTLWLVHWGYLVLCARENKRRKWIWLPLSLLEGERGRLEALPTLEEVFNDAPDGVTMQDDCDGRLLKARYAPPLMLLSSLFLFFLFPMLSFFSIFCSFGYGMGGEWVWGTGRSLG